MADWLGAIVALSPLQNMVAARAAGKPGVKNQIFKAKGFSLGIREQECQEAIGHLETVLKQIQGSVRNVDQCESVSLSPRHDRLAANTT